MAVYTEVIISGMALGHIGVGQAIDDLGGNGSLERTCNRFYNIARDEIFERYDWPAHRRQVALGLVAEDPNGDWAYSYRYPINCFALLRLVSTAGLPQSEPIPYQLGQDDTGRLIYTDTEDAIAEVAYFADDPGEWPSLLAKAISWSLASYICGPLGKGGKREECLVNIERSFTTAAGVAAKQQANKPRPPSSYVSGR